VQSAHRGSAQVIEHSLWHVLQSDRTHALALFFGHAIDRASSLKLNVIMDALFFQVCAEGQAEAARELLAQGANAAGRDGNQSTPLHCACRSGSVQTVRTVLEAHGCDIDAVDSKGRNAVYWACSSASIDMLRLLERAAQLSSPKSAGQVIAAVEWW
jgi:ankyrin repeat protein